MSLSRFIGTLFTLKTFRKKRREKVESVPRPRSTLKKRVPGLLQKELNRGEILDESFDGGPFKGRRNLNNSIL